VLCCEDPLFTAISISLSRYFKAQVRRIVLPSPPSILWELSSEDLLFTAISMFLSKHFKAHPRRFAPPSPPSTVFNVYEFIYLFYIENSKNHLVLEEILFWISIPHSLHSLGLPLESDVISLELHTGQIFVLLSLCNLSLISFNIR